MPFLEKLFELIMGLMANCPGSRGADQRSKLKGMVRNPSRLAKWVVRRRARQQGIEATEAEWEEAYAMGATLSDIELDLLISESWSAFANDG